jgi:DNA helicase II / ATP-dependent DNA helicase PcrA
MGLNEAQQQAVENTDGPLMILAGAGSGKTRTIVKRIIYLVEEKNISPYNILAVTFSNKAAKEMRERVAQELGTQEQLLKITTFHSFCSNILRSEAKYLGLSRSFTIYDDQDTKSLAKSLIKQYCENPKEYAPSELLYYIDQLKNQAYYIGRDDFDDEKKLLDEHFEFSMFKAYESELARSNAVDFGGLITNVIKLFKLHPEVKEKYQNKFKYLLVDEYQDTNKAQFEFLLQIVNKQSNICVVGDEDQSIYSWRGADIRNILYFEKYFPQTQVIKLEQNYRSTKRIIEAASAVIEKNQQRKGKTLWTDNDSGEEINIIESENDINEASFITRKIMEYKNTNIHLNDIAIFYRNNYQSRVIEEALRSQNVPYRIVGGMKFYERKEIKDLVAYLKVILNEKDSLSLSRIINSPPRGIGTTTMRKFEHYAIDQNISLWESIKDIFSEYKSLNIRLSQKVKTSLTKFINMFIEARDMVKNQCRPSEIYEYILRESEYVDYLKKSKDYDKISRVDNLEELLNAIKQFEYKNEKANLLDFLESITLDKNSEDTENVGQVSLMTVHSSKGLEFHYVFIAGVEENIFPSARSIDESLHGIEEERRLFYVAMTRAMKKLYIVFARSRMLYGDLQFNGPSQFIYEIPEEYYQWINQSKNKQKNNSTWSSKKITQKNYVDYSDEYSQVIEATKTYEKGIDVEHQLYGVGTVINSEGNGKEEKVTIKFHQGSTKKFLVWCSPIKQI